MRIVVRVVPRSLCEELYLATPQVAGVEWVYVRGSEHAHIFPCESFAQAAIDYFMARQKPHEWYADIQDADDAERGALEPEWTGPMPWGNPWLPPNSNVRDVPRR